jgi:hypothetical protein
MQRWEIKSAKHLYKGSPTQERPGEIKVMEKNKKIRIYLKHINAEQAMLTSTHIMNRTISTRRLSDRSIHDLYQTTSTVGQIVSYSRNTTSVEQAILTILLLTI